VLAISPNRDPFHIASVLERTDQFGVLEFDAYGTWNETPNDPQYSNQWNLPKIQMDDAWDITAGSSSIILAIIDSGTRYTHEDIDGNVWVNPAEDRNGNGLPDFYSYGDYGDLDGIDNDGNGFVDDLIGWDFYQSDNDPDDAYGHGTNVAGVSSAQTDNYENGAYRGIAGVAGGWGTLRGACVMVLRMGNTQPVTSYTAQAIEYAADNGARVINVSSSLDDLQVLREAVDFAVDTCGVVIVASVGNNGDTGDPSIRYPAKYSKTIAVGATDQNDNRRSYSAYGPEMDVVAPDGVPSTTMAGGYTTGLIGTSFSAPHVAGLAALIRSVNPNLTWQQVRDVLRASADKVSGMGGQNFTNQYGYGRLNANSAVRNLYVPDEYSTISSAISAAVSGQTVVINSGTHNISGNTALGTGVSLTIKSGATVNLNGYQIVATGGGGVLVESGATVGGLAAKISNPNGGLFPSIQGAVNHSSWSHTIELLATTYNESPNFSSKSYITLVGQGPGSTILNGAISVTNSTEISISGLSMSGGLYANNSSNTWFNNATITGTTLAMIYGGIGTQIGHGLGPVTAVDIGASFGVTGYNSSGNANYCTIYNGDCAVYLTNNAAWDIAPGNHFCDNGYDVDASYGASAYVRDNSYSRAFPSSVYGNVTYPPEEIYADVCGSLRKSQLTTTEYGGPLAEPVGATLSDLDGKYLALISEISKARADSTYALANYVQNYLELIDRYKTLIHDGIEKSTAISALSKVSHLYEGMEDFVGFKRYIAELLANGTLAALEPYLKRYLIWDYVNGRQFDSALKTSDEVLSSPEAGVDLIAEMLYEKGLIYQYYLSDASKANAMFTQLSTSYPSSPLARFAKLQMSIDPLVHPDMSKGMPEVNLTSTVTSLDIYPNPFNATSTLKFSLPYAVFVSLRVYDVLGREVLTLVNDSMTAGAHFVRIDASNLASGTYFVKLEAGEVLVKKIQLLR